MDRIIFGDNQFFAVNHISDEKARLQAIKFNNDAAILDTLNTAIDSGVETFMCTTHGRMKNICQAIRDNQIRYRNLKIYPCMPYAHKYANSVTELGIAGTLKEVVPGNLFSSLFKGGAAILSKDLLPIIELMIDAEMKPFIGLNTPIIFLQNVITDLLLGLKMNKILVHFYNYVNKKYNAEPGFITMNLPLLLDVLEKENIANPVVCSSINVAGFRMSGGKSLYEFTLRTRRFRAIAMQVLAGGATNPKEAIEYITRLPNIQSILFGASSKKNILETVSLIEGARKSPSIEKLSTADH